MKIKNINFSLAILASLIVLSFAFFVSAQNSSSTQNNIFLDSDQDGLTDQEEKLYGTNSQLSDTDGDGYSDGTEIKSGYNPLKPAPNDKIVSNTAVKNSSAPQAPAPSENLTERVAIKLSEMTANADEETSITLNDIVTMVDESLNSPENANTQTILNIPEIKEEDLKIKKQNYSKLSKEKQKEKKKEDFTEYITAVFYILSSNSPKPITSAKDINAISTAITQEIIDALDSRDSSALNDLSKSGEKILEEMKNVEVPEELVETHIKALRFAYYSKELKNYITPNTGDPLKDITNFSQIKAFISSLSDFMDDVQVKFDEYDLSLNDEEIQKKMKDLGISKELIEGLSE